MVVVAALEGFVEQIVRKLTLDIVANLVAAPSEGGTPVDTGWARANWVPEIGRARTTTAGTYAQAAAGNASTAEQQAGAAKILSWKLKQGTIHVTNNVPYIIRLNEGSSRQAPRGFVQAAIAKAVRVDLPRGFRG